jgi:hypothetical protein
MQVIFSVLLRARFFKFENAHQEDEESDPEVDEPDEEQGGKADKVEDEDHKKKG